MSSAYGDISDTLVISQRAETPKQRGPLVYNQAGQPAEVLRGKLVKAQPSSSDRERLLAVLQTHFIFKHLSAASQADVVTQMQLHRIGAGQVVVQEGDPGDYFFITVRGEVEVIVNGMRRHVLPPYSCFGDMALLGDAPRSASIKSVGKAWYWVLDRFSFKAAVQRVNELYYSEHLEFLNSVQLFEGFTSAQKEHMLRFFNTQQWEPGQVIVKEGDQGSMMFLITEGVVDCTWLGRPLRRLGRGDVFGEQALLHARVRTATVSAVTQVSLLSASAENLEQCFGDSLEQVIYNNTIRLAFQKSPVLSALTNTQTQALIEAMSIRTCDAGEVLVSHGSAQGSGIWVVLKGSLLYGQDEVKAFTCVGDEALAAKDQAWFECDLKTKAGTVIAELSAEDLERVLGNQLKGIKRQNNVLALLKTVPLFKHLPKSKLLLIGDRLNKAKYDQGAVITTEGSMGDSFFIIKTGSVHIQKGTTILRTLEAASYFGERALLTTEVRSASAVAATDLVCWTLQKHEFLELLDPSIQHQLKKRMDMQDDAVELSDLLAVKQLGSGGSAQVWLCKHRNKDTCYALKVLSRAAVTKLGLDQAVANEEQLLHSLDHPMVLKLVKTYNDQTRLYFLTEYVHGLDLFDALRLIGSVSEPQAKFFVSCLVMTLEHLHRKRVVYRDLKPENVMVDEEGYLKLIDLGASKQIAARTYTTIGTPHYMAPEAIIGSGYDFAVDYWSLGVMLYEFLYGDVPFGRDVEEPTLVYQEILAHKLVFPTNRTFPRANKFIECLLHPQPHLRGSTRTLKAHNWLVGTDWEGLWTRSVKPGFIPELREAVTGELQPVPDCFADFC